MRNIILIQPFIGIWDNVLSKPSIPLGLLRISTFLYKDYNIRIIDQRTNPDWKKTLLTELKCEPVCVGLRIKSGNSVLHGLNISKFIKIHSLSTPIIWGGSFPTMTPELCLNTDVIDFVIRGEGELSFAELVNSLVDNKPIENIKGLSFKKDNKIVHNAIAPFFDLDREIPYSLINVKDYMPKYNGRPSLFMETSRGCPNSCTFCFNSLAYGKKWRRLAPNKIIEHIKFLSENFKVKHIYFIDDNFFLDLKRVRTFLKDLVKEKLDITWHAQGACISDIVRMNKSDIVLLKRSGCRNLQLGIQSGAERIRKMVGINISEKEITDVNRKLKDAGITPYFYFMIGFPTETKEELNKTINLALKLLKINNKAITSPFYCCELWPATPLFKLAQQIYGLKAPDNLEYWIHSEYSKIRMPWLSEREKKNLQMLHFLSLFFDSKFRWYSDSLVLKFFVSLYNPVARFRLKRRFFRFSVDKYLINKLCNLFWKANNYFD